MKKLFSKLFVVGALGGIFFMSGCGGDDDEDTAPPALSVSVTAADADDIYDPGETIALTVSFSSEAGLSGLSYYYTVDGTDGQTQVINLNDPDLAGLNLNDDSFTFNLGIDNSLAGTSSSVTVVAIDQSLNEADGTYFFTVTDAPTISEYQTVLLGGQSNPDLESFYNVMDNAKYFTSAAGTNDDMVDLVFYYVSTDGLEYMIASPDNDEVQITFDMGWPLTTENSTRFKTLDGSFSFDNTTTSSDLESAYGEVGTELTRMTDLQVGQVFAFQTDASRGSRFGIIEVDGTDDGSLGGPGRTITLNIKIQSEDN